MFSGSRKLRKRTVKKEIDLAYMESQSLNSYTKSLTAGSNIVPDAFPNLIIRSCVSEASESLNGPRYAAQDKKSFLVYEVRYNPVEVNDLDRNDYPDVDEDDAQTSFPAEQRCWWTRQEERLKQLRLCAQYHFPLVSFPQSIYLYANSTSTGRTHPGVCSVEELCGLSLGDIVRSGWTLVEESLFNDVLEAVEVFGKMTPVLPPHGNISADAIKQLLTVRETAEEMEHRSRWVVGDWLLTPPDEEHYDLFSTISDVEWMLNSTFSQFRIQNGISGTLLSASDIEFRIGVMTSRLRDELALRCGTSSSSAVLRAGDALENKEEVEKYSRIRTRPFRPTTKSNTHSSIEKTRSMGIKERIIFHQNALLEEQQQLNRYRRKYAPLPPRPHPRSEEADYGLESQEYKPKAWSAPIIIKPSAFFCPSHADGKGVRSGNRSSRRKYHKERKRGKGEDKEEQMHGQPQIKQLETLDTLRDVVVHDIAHVALEYKHHVAEKRRVLEEESRRQRECVQRILASSASVSPSRTRGSTANDSPLCSSSSRFTEVRGKRTNLLFPPNLKNLFSVKSGPASESQDTGSSMLGTARSSSTSRIPTMSRRRTLNSTLAPTSHSTRSSSNVSSTSQPTLMNGCIRGPGRASSTPRESRRNTARPASAARRFTTMSRWSTGEIIPGNTGSVNSSPNTASRGLLASVSSSLSSSSLSSSSVAAGKGAWASTPTVTPPISFIPPSKDILSSPGGSFYAKTFGSSNASQSMVVQGRKEMSGSHSHSVSGLSAVSLAFPSSPTSPDKRPSLSSGLAPSIIPCLPRESGGHHPVHRSALHPATEDSALPANEGHASFSSFNVRREGSISSLHGSPKAYAPASTSLRPLLHPFLSTLLNSQRCTQHHSGRPRHVDTLSQPTDTASSVIHVPKTIHVHRHHHHHSPHQHQSHDAPMYAVRTARYDSSSRHDEERRSPIRKRKSDPQGMHGKLLIDE